MSDADALDRRLRAVERALTDGDSDLTDLRDAAELTREVERLSARLDAIDERLDDLDAATQALRGYVGNVRALDRSVERRADAALAKAESLEATLCGDGTGGGNGVDDSNGVDGGSDASDGGETHPDGERARPDRPCDWGSQQSFGDGRAETDRGTGDEDDADTGEDGLLARLAGVL
ncbi:hypothetical protein M0R88_12550 [Halorussus gelatinilyticus]|uniref:DUF7310 domain-containing protein n=1 Tax=Halorussus gelatinilyticus TaxID=2937524 RepID=A0A8U0IGI1_9EURY|nr:hypothetical protein [Halorussus gelatinilyticus]UPV99351.1 hypothetical protein M0R88_12550 [Halorussus gelatinilyticus]